jgi:hypothetical protein
MKSDAIEFANERDAPDDNQPVPEERVDPYISESYLSVHPDKKFTK